MLRVYFDCTFMSLRNATHLGYTIQAAHVGLPVDGIQRLGHIWEPT